MPCKMEENNTYPTNFEPLKDDFCKKKPIVIFLGTGINANKQDDLFWGALLDSLFAYTFDLIPQLQGNTKEAKIIKKLFSGQRSRIFIRKKTESMFPRDVKSTIVKQFLGDAFYRELIRDFLYKKISKEDLNVFGSDYIECKKTKKIPQSFFSLYVIADMILHCPNIKAVVTYNYDQFLEEALDFLKNNSSEEPIIKYHIISNWEFDEISNNSYDYNDVNIYHVHGFIPRYDEIQSPKNTNIILSLDEYYEDTKNVYSWQIASQIHFLSQYTCWFCGLSLDDITTQRLLHYVKNTHKEHLYYLTAHCGYGKKKLDPIAYTLEETKNRYHEKNGLTVVYDKNGFNNMYKLIGELNHEKKS